MEYIYASLLLHKAGKTINEANLENVMKAAGISPDIGRIKAVTAALEGVDIENALKSMHAMPVVQTTATEAPKIEEKKEKEEEKKDEMTGLGALFG